ncbi:glycosyltransferase family 2 protein [Dethiosulfovibrio peptidovorans]|nr:glycosyltransferase family 2 protein [Dethiosulfovibrio peptidovorans]
MEDKMKISLYTVTKNEEARLPLMLEAAAPLADEIIVVDSGSTDRTRDVAERYGAKFIHHDWTSIGHQVAFAESCCSNEWVLRLDADEVMSKELLEEIMKIKKNGPDCDGYKLRSGEMFPGYSKPNRWVKHYQLVRLYSRKAMRMSGKFGFDDVVFIKKTPQTRLLYNFINHYSFLSIRRTVEKRNVATDDQVKRALLEHKNYSPWRMVGCMVGNFFRYFILERYFLYGFWGFIHSVNVGYMRFLKFSKFYEYHQIREHGYMGCEKKNELYESEVGKG